jgi:hypothetical protein
MTFQRIRPVPPSCKSRQIIQSSAQRQLNTLKEGQTRGARERRLTFALRPTFSNDDRSDPDNYRCWCSFPKTSSHQQLSIDFQTLLSLLERVPPTPRRLASWRTHLRALRVECWVKEEARMRCEGRCSSRVQREEANRRARLTRSMLGLEESGKEREVERIRCA